MPLISNDLTLTLTQGLSLTISLTVAPLNYPVSERQHTYPPSLGNGHEVIWEDLAFQSELASFLSCRIHNMRDACLDLVPGFRDILV